VPDPVHGLVVVRVSFPFPQILTLESLIDLIGFNPVGRNFFFVTSTDRTAFGLAYFISDPEFALSVQVDPDHPKIFGLD
jgi:hypothetical protein